MPNLASPLDPAGAVYWFTLGSCRGSLLPPEAWFPVNNASTAADDARRICRACMVREDCHAEAMRVPDTVGIWAGLDENQRRALGRR